MDPMEILPAEIWVKIFHRIQEAAADWLNLYQASPSFQSVVGPERVQALFPLVMPQLSKYLLKGNNSRRPHPQQLLPLRLVSRKWRDGVDMLIEKNQELDDDERVEGLSNQLNYYFSTPHKILSFLEKFENHPTSPIIGRSIRLLCNPLHQHQHSSLLLMRLMHKFGTHLKGIEIFFTFDNKADINLFVDQVQDLLQLAPALERLTIEGWKNLFWTSPGQLQVTVQTTESLPPPPPAAALPNLKSLVIKAGCRTMEREVRLALQDAILRLISCSSGNNNSSSLSEVTLESGPAQLTIFPNLSSVSLVGATREGLSQLRNLKCPLLSKLSMDWPIPDINIIGITIGHVFGVVSHFGETLTSLSIKISFPIHQKNACKQPPPLALPRLKSLRLISGESAASFSSLDFLADLAELEVLHLEGWWIERKNDDGGSNHQSKGNNKMQIPSGKVTTTIDDMRESNIWELLPRLRKFHFSGGFLRCATTSNLEGFRHVYSRGKRGGLHFKNLLLENKAIM